MEARQFKNPWTVRLLVRLMRWRLRPFARVWAAVLGVDIGDQWPQRLVLPHPYAVVIHGDAAIGPDCVIYQGVTIGENGEGTGPPSLGARVKVFANATLVGPIRIGDDAVIGANSVVTKDVPDRSLAFGVPARVVRGLREDELQSGGGSA